MPVVSRSKRGGGRSGGAVTGSFFQAAWKEALGIHGSAELLGKGRQAEFSFVAARSA